MVFDYVLLGATRFLVKEWQVNLSYRTLESDHSAPYAATMESIYPAAAFHVWRAVYSIMEFRILNTKCLGTDSWVGVVAVHVSESVRGGSGF
jgi:hypothetical protein